MAYSRKTRNPRVDELEAALAELIAGRRLMAA